MDKQILERIQKNRPSLSPNSLKTYKSILMNLAKRLEIKDIDDFETETKKILESLKDIEPSKRKTTLASLVVLCEDNEDCVKEYRSQMMKDSEETKKAIDKNEMSDKQKENWLSFEQIEKIYKALENRVKPLWEKETLTNKEFQELQNYVILSMYILIPPRRLLDYAELKIHNYDEEKDNYYKDGILYINNYKTKKSHGNAKIDLKKNIKLKNILKKWISKNPSEYFFIDNKKNKLSVVQLNQRLNNIFDGKKVSVNIIRHSFINKIYPETLKPLEELKEIANDMGHNLETALEYRKITSNRGKK